MLLLAASSLSLFSYGFRSLYECRGLSGSHSLPITPLLILQSKALLEDQPGVQLCLELFLVRHPMLISQQCMLVRE